jgi:ABC-type phosphate/phosphonate transport system substrate-binding protein
MKKYLFVTSILFFISLSPLRANDKVAEKSAREIRIEQLTNRVEEIQAIDFDELSKAEKKELKKELKEINKELKSEGLGKPVTLSIGAIIIIVLLLIIIL